jgi:hypothetical protein
MFYSGIEPMEFVMKVGSKAWLENGHCIYGWLIIRRMASEGGGAQRTIETLNFRLATAVQKFRVARSVGLSVTCAVRRLLGAFSFAILLLFAGVRFPSLGYAQQLPQQLQPPANERKLLRVHGKGDQIYSCNADGAQYAWTLRAPEARLYTEDGKPFGSHFAGPSWKANDGSQVTGKAAASVPSPDVNSIPWLLVTVVSHSGEGKLARVTSIQRINTRGGKAPAAGCDAAHLGRELRAHYSADYVFFGP